MARGRTALLPVEAFGVDGFADGKAVWFWHPLLVLNSRRSVGPTGLRQTFNPRMPVTRRIRRRGCRGACHRAELRADPVAHPGFEVLRVIAFNRAATARR